MGADDAIETRPERGGGVFPLAFQEELERATKKHEAEMEDLEEEDEGEGTIIRTASLERKIQRHAETKETGRGN